MMILFQHTNRVLHVRYDEEILKRLDSSSSLRLSPGAAKRLAAATRSIELALGAQLSLWELVFFKNVVEKCPKLIIYVGFSENAKTQVLSLSQSVLNKLSSDHEEMKTFCNSAIRRLNSLWPEPHEETIGFVKIRLRKDSTRDKWLKWEISVLRQVFGEVVCELMSASMSACTAHVLMYRATIQVVSNLLSTPNKSSV